MFNTVCYYSATLLGPTGPLQPRDYEQKRRHTAWSSEGSREFSAAILNESVVEGNTHVLGPGQAAVYVQVDDTVVLSSDRCTQLHSDAILKCIVDNIEPLGFGVSLAFEPRARESRRIQPSALPAKAGTAACQARASERGHAFFGSVSEG